jgi:hypothetical protein
MSAVPPPQMTTRASLRHTVVVIGALASVMLAVFAIPASASATSSGNSYWTDLPTTISGPTSFTVYDDGTVQVCAMSFEGVTITAEPFTFTFSPQTPGVDTGQVSVNLCAGGVDTVDLSVVYANVYSTDFPGTASSATPFTITVTGPTPVCQMTFNGQVDTSAPWSFTYLPTMTSYGSDDVGISPCTGGRTDFYLPMIFGDTLTTDLAPYVSGPTAFTVDVQGPVTVCSMTLGSETLTHSPWTLTFDPLSGESTVDVAYCSGNSDQVYLDSVIPISLPFGAVVSGESTSRPAVTVQSNLPDSSETVELVDARGETLRTVTLAPEDQAVLSLSRSGSSPTTSYSVRATTTSGFQMSLPVVVSKGWVPLLSAFFPDCSTLTWVYDPRGQPKGTSTALLLSDIEGALRRLSATTGLTFARSTDRSLEGKLDVITYEWSTLATGVAGLGGPDESNNTLIDGTVQLSKVNWWATANGAAGFGRLREGIGGRGWLIVHETMHALGFGHTTNPNDVMYYSNHGQHALGAGDLAGLHYAYPKTCPAPAASP